jgi:hypothetical protein
MAQVLDAHVRVFAAPTESEAGLMEILLSQSEADAFIAMPKVRTDETEWAFSGAALAIPLTSEDRRTNFFLDLSRGRISLAKGKYQNRVHQSVILVRLDFGGAPHRNPDGVEMTCPHLHIYREGYGDKWAFAVPADKFSNISDTWATLEDFMRYCTITQPPIIQRGLFA